MADIARGVRSFTMGTALSRVLGLVRDSVIAYLFGAGTATDAYNAAFRIPNLLRDLFAENALSSAFVPVLMDQKEKGREAENRFASNIFNSLLLVVGLITVAGMLASSALARVIAFGFDKVPGKLALTGGLTQVMFPFLLFIALGAWAMSILNTHGSFFVPAVAPAFFNIFSIAAPIALFAYLRSRGVDPVYGLAIGVTAGGLMQFLVQAPSLFKLGFRYRPYLNFRDPEFKRMMGFFMPVVIGLSGARFNVFVSTFLVSLLAEKSLTWLNNAYRIMNLPLGLFGVAVGTVALSTLSRFVVEKNPAAIRDTLFDSMRMVLFLTIPTSALIGFLAGPITDVIYRRGRFTAADAAGTAAILTIYMIGVPFISVLRNVAAVFYAHKDARSPMIASFISVGVNLVLNVALMWKLGTLAFPLSATIAAAVNVAYLYGRLPDKIGAVDSKPLFRYAGALLFASLSGGAAGWTVYWALGHVLGRGQIWTFLNLAFSGAAGFGMFYVVAVLIGIEDVKKYIRRFIKI
jgi:putative peptidoglycan lipid II flippase